MSTYKRKTTLKLDCNIEKSLSIISGKWKPAILSELLKKNVRLKDIQKGLPEASKRALTQQLGELVNDGLIQKHDFNEYPKKTEYTMSPLGIQLASVFKELDRFGDKLS